MDSFFSSSRTIGMMDKYRYYLLRVRLPVASVRVGRDREALLTSRGREVERDRETLHTRIYIGVGYVVTFPEV